MAFMAWLSTKLNVLMNNPRARQTIALYMSLMISLILGIAVSVINTRFLTPREFGDFKLLQTVWTVGVLFVTFGLLSTGGNLLAKTQTKDDEKNLLGSLLLITAIISMLFIVLMIAASLPFGQLYGEEFGQKVRLYAGLLFVFPFQLFLQEALRGTNDIYSLAFLNAMPQLFYIPSAIAVKHYLGFSLDWAILIYLLCTALTVMIISLLSKPSFSNIGTGIYKILSRNRSLGVHIYAASLITTTSSYLGQFTLGYFETAQQVGEFSLALTITMPLSMVPNAVATTFFKHFANSDSIPLKVLNASLLLTLLTLIGFILAIKTIILFLYTDRFANVIPLTYLCALGSVIQGMGDVYNRYLLANGKTSLLRVNAMQRGLVSTFGYTFLVFGYGTMGAASTKVIDGLLYLLTMLIHYNRESSKVISTKEQS